VFEAMEIDVTGKVMAHSASATDAAAAVQAGCEAFIDLTQDPAVRQFIRRPFGARLDKWREIDNRLACGLLKAALETAAKEAGLPAALVDAFAHMLLASLFELAILIAWPG
jgi:hypothetical protein